MFSVDSPGIDAAGKVAESETCMSMSITEMLETFVVSFQTCCRLFVIITMTSLGSGKRPFRHRIRCEVRQKRVIQKQKMMGRELSFLALQTKPL